MTTALKSKSPDSPLSRRALLGERLRQLTRSPQRRPLSFAQQRLWFLDQLESKSPLYNIAAVADLRGGLQLPVLEQAINSVIARHEALRTQFTAQEGCPEQSVLPELSCKLHIIKVAGGTPQEIENEAQRLTKIEVARPFDLASAPLLRTTLLELGPCHWRLVLVVHHIVFDEWSLKVFWSEVAAFYTAALAGETPQLPPLPIQYSDYSEWQRDHLQGEILQQQVAYWKNQLAGSSHGTELPADRPRPPVPSFKGGNCSRRLPEDLAAAAKVLAHTQNATLFMVLLAAFKALVFRYTGEHDLLVGAPIAGRNKVETEPLVGFFVNTLPLRTSLAGNPTFEELVVRVREVTLGAFAHQDLPFERIVHELHPERSLNQMPFARMMFLVQNGPLEQFKLPDVSVEFLPFESDLAKFELTFAVREGARDITIHAEYNRDLFDHATVERLLQHFETLLRGAVANSSCRVGQLPLLSPGERHQILVEWNNTARPYPAEKPIHEIFEAHAAKMPDAIAATYGEMTITYGELNARANQLARYLRQFGVGQDLPVGICMHRSAAMLAGLLAILKAGAVYVPLDPRYPQERLRFILQDTRAPVLLTEQGLLSNMPRVCAKVVCLDSDWELAAREERQNLAVPVSAEQLAYVMYTSGSTGEPKGVAVPHRAVARLVINTNYIELGPQDRIAQVSNFSFDAATFEIWGALLNGAQVVGISGDVALSPQEFAAELRTRGITAMFLTSALFNQLAAEVPGAFETVGTVIAGGEALDPKWVRAVLAQRPPRRLLNGYGPTENTTFTCCHEIRHFPESSSSVPIGRPIANTQVYILDSDLNPVPIGVPGQLYAGGDGLARGYWRRPSLTSERFVRNPFYTGSGSALLYKTGDLARYLPDGSIEFLGRLDTQVKIRGFRIELGEIEAVLAQHAGVQQCVVTVHGQNSGKRLIAYLVPSGQVMPNASELRSFLAQKLPAYMLPAAFVSLPSIPVTPNGKVDRKALPAPDQERPELERKYVPPADEVELQLTRIWETVLGVRPIGIQDKFFDLGGHSLLAVRVIGLIEKNFGRKLRLATIFKAPTIRELAAVLREEIKESTIAAKSSVVEIQGQGARPPLFLVHGAGGGMFWGYVNLSRHLGTDQPVFGFKSRGLDGRDELENISAIAAQYIHDLRQVQPHGPYFLGGYCFGGNVAFEMARQLADAGEEIAFLGLLNCAPPNSRYTRIPWTGRWALRFLRNLVYWANYCRHWSRTQRRDFIRWKRSLLKNRIANFIFRRTSRTGHVQVGDVVDLSSFTEEERKVWAAHIQALLHFEPRPYSGRVHLFRSPGHPLWCSFDPDYGWGDFAEGGVDMTVVPGAHEKILEEPCVAALADRLKAALEQACRTTVRRSATGQPQPADFLQGPAKSYPLHLTYSEHFAAVAERSPSATAVIAEETTLTYAQLNRRANQLAAYLQSRGIAPESLVAVCMDRSIELPVSLLAILKAGGAYLPLDPTYPKDRLEYMLSDSRASLVLTRKSLLHAVQSMPPDKVICVDDPEQANAWAGLSDANPPVSSTPDNLAYVIYTSGSTGTPKGVEITQRSLLSHNFAVLESYELCGSDRVLQFAPISFDISVEEIFPTWLAGGAVVLRSEKISSPAEFLQQVSRDRVTLLNLPTAFWHELVEAIGPERTSLSDSVRLVVVGGEKASDEAFRRWRERVPGSVRLMNGYGVTEATVSSTVYTARPEDRDLPIGRPLANTTALILDEYLRPVVPGNTGELYIGGPGVARGYRNREELTAQRFIQNPFKADDPSERLYKTGDLVRLREDGNLEFLGRLDEQVKISGYRIELGEIEAALREHPDIKDAAVVAREQSAGKRLVAYFVPRSPLAPPRQQITAFLKRKLPSYMLPAAFVQMESFPLTPAGKIDRRALPQVSSSRPELAQPYAAPSTALQEQLADIWSEVLSINPVGINDDFFDLGGHSLLAIQMTSRIRDTLHIEVPLNALFACPTVAALANHIAAMPQPTMTLAPSNRATELPVTPAQRRVWFLDIFEPQCSPYNRALGVRIEGALEVEVLRRALVALARRHEALRAVFPAEDGHPAQYILESEELNLPCIDLSQLPEDQRSAEALKRAAEESARTHITAQPLLRSVLFRMQERQHWLLIVVHELAADSRSMRLIYEELTAAYEALAAGKPEPFPELIARYSAAVPALVPSDEQKKKDLQYWADELQGAPPLLALPADRPRPDHRADAGARYPIEIPEKVAVALEELSSSSGGTLFGTLLSAFASLLSRYTGTNDIVIGTNLPLATGTPFESTVGNFENAVALRCRLEDDLPFEVLVQRVDKAVARAKEHSRVAFAEVLEYLNPPRNPSYTPVFQTMLLYEEQSLPSKHAAGAQFTPFDIDKHTAQVDLALLLTRTEHGISGAIEFSSSLFNASRIARLSGHLLTLLESAVKAPNTPVSALRIVPDTELKLLADWNNTQQPIPQKTILHLVLEQAARTPNACALICGAERLTYCELLARAQVISRELRARGVVKPETLVGVCLERSPDMVAAILGTFMAGAAYVPIDPVYPRDRIRFILEDAHATVLLTHSKLLELACADPQTAPAICLDKLAGQASDTTADWENNLRPENLAYVIYTSGSTGRPKGVALEHRNAVSFISWALRTFTREELKGVLAATSICFDLSIFEMFVPLSCGGTLILAANALALPSLPAATEVTLINTVPSAIRELLRIRGVPSSVKIVNLAGEPLSAELADEIYAETAVEKVYDLYGPTETTTYSTFAHRKRGEAATIGRPLDNEQVYILDSRRQQMPIGIPGELYIGGAGVAREYLNRPDITSERFIAHPFQEGQRLYKTGDLARWREDGNLEYLGRLDHQVKIRGYRIELGEVEAAVKALPAVRDAVVIAREDWPGDKRLVAYLVPAGEQVDTRLDLRAALKERLPEFMIPAAFVWLEQLPLTPNGKVDRKALPAPEQRSSDAEEFVAPRNAMEEQLATIWCEVLRRPKVSVMDNFFNLGGHSLLAIQVSSRVREVFKVELPLFALFTAPTIAALAEGLAAGEWSSDETPMLPLQPVSREKPIQTSFVQERLWFLHQLEPQSPAYNVPSALRLKGKLETDAFQRALNELVRRHESLRTTFKFEGDRLNQVIAPDVSVPVALVDLSSAPEPERKTAAKDWLKREANRPFDLEKGPLIRVGLCRVASDEHLLSVVMHHIISDGWSLAVLYQEWAALYDQLASAQLSPPAFSELPIQYADYAAWQRQAMSGQVLERELTFWKKTLTGAPPEIKLRTDKITGGGAKEEAGRAALTIPQGLTSQLIELARKQSATSFMLLKAALALTLRRWTGQSDLVLGTVVAGRHRREVENLIGCFMNFLPLRIRLPDNISCLDALRACRETILEAQGHQDCPFERIVEAVNPQRRLDGNPLYNVALLFQNFPPELFPSALVRSERTEVQTDAPLLDLRFEAENSPEGLYLTCEYRADLFSPATIEQLLSSFVSVLEIFALRPETLVQDVRLTPALEARIENSLSERYTLVVAGTFTAEPIGDALRYWMERLGVLAEIEFAPYNQIFQQLLDPGSATANNRRGLNLLLLRLEDWLPKSSPCDQDAAHNLERSAAEFYEALKLAVAKVTTPFLVCLCPASPKASSELSRSRLLEETEQRLAEQLSSISGVHLLRASEMARLYPVGDYYDASGEDLGHIPYTPLFFSALATAVARKFHALHQKPVKVIALDCDNTLWTGVCGEDGPQGITLDEPRTALQEFMRAQTDAGVLLCLCSKNNEEDVLAVFAQRQEMPLGREHFAAVRLNWEPKSANLVALARELNLGLDSFVFVDDNPVECAEVRANCPEVVTLQLPQDISQIPAFLNHCWVFDHLNLTAEDRRRADLYRENQQREQLRAASSSLTDFLASLDLQIRVEPMQTENLARVAQLTQRTNQFNTTTRRLGEPEVQHLAGEATILTVTVRDRFGDYGLTGVLAAQVRGESLDVDIFLLSCRVLGRGVEHRMLAVLGEHAVRHGARWVDVHFIQSAKNKPALDFLEAVGGQYKQPLNGGYVFRFPAQIAAAARFEPRAPAEPETGKEPGVTGVQAPSSGSYVRLEDYAALAMEAREPASIHHYVEAAHGVRTVRQAGYKAPGTDLEAKLVELWQKLLHVDRVGTADDFFELGGHSLLAVRLFAEIEKLTGRKLPLVTLFQAATIESLARILSDESSVKANRSLLVPVQPKGSRPPLFLVHGAGGDVLWGYANLAAHLCPDQPIYGIKSRGQIGLEECDRVDEMAAHYVQAVREFQPEGPYFLGGYCFGGNVAYEMARQLRAAGQEVAIVALLDSAPANAGYETVTWWRPGYPFRFLRNATEWAKDFAGLQASERRTFFARKLRAFGRKLVRRIRRAGGDEVDIEEVIDPSHFPESELKLWRIHLQAMTRHVDQPFEGKVVLLRTKGQPLFCSLEEDFCWSRLVRGGIRVVVIPGSHENVFLEPNVRALARELDRVLKEAQNKVSDPRATALKMAA